TPRSAGVLVLPADRGHARKRGSAWRRGRRVGVLREGETALFGFYGLDVPTPRRDIQRGGGRPVQRDDRARDEEILRLQLREAVALRVILRRRAVVFFVYAADGRVDDRDAGDEGCTDAEVLRDLVPDADRGEHDRRDLLERLVPVRRRDVLV